MRVPILKQGDYVIASIQSALTDEDLVQLRDGLASHVGKYRSKGVIVDVTVLDVMDSFATRTVRDLAQMVADKQFRSDLFYRLKVFPVFSPPLRERTGPRV